MSIRRIATVGAMVLALGLGASARNVRAGVIQFNPNGTGAPGAIALGSFEEPVGNAVAVGAAPQTVGSVFQVYYQAQISQFRDPNNGIVNPPAGTEFTIIAGFQERITGITVTPGGTNFTFGFVPGGTNYVEMYVNKPPAANNSAGTGFNSGKMILQGTITPAPPYTSTAFVGNFTVGSPTPVNFDNFDGAATPPKFQGKTTTAGGGQSFLGATITSVDPNFFVTPPASFTLNFRTSTGDPFNDLSPSLIFTTMKNTTGIGTAGPSPTYSPTLFGASGNGVNGIDGPDVQFEANGANTFDNPVPEPASVVLLSIGAIVGLVGRTKLLGRRPV
jgi:hypothetical protein